jgi:UDP-MurNAc hydroxylase
MAKDLHYLGFQFIQEIPHGGCVELAPGFYLHSFQFGLAHDSAVVLNDGTVTLLNANDCKIFGLPLQQIRAQFHNFDFVMRSHSNARLLPYCLEDYKTYMPNFRTNNDYIEEFTNFCLNLRTRYASPFASNHCFLHRDTEHLNKTMVRPSDIMNHYTRAAQKLDIDSKLVIMPAGSSWSTETGFLLREFNYDNVEENLEYLKKKHAKKLQEYYELEEKEIFDENAFRAYFERLLRIPWFIKPFRITFKISDRNGEAYWLIDSQRKRVVQVDKDAQFDVLIEMQSKVLNDCTKGMFRVWMPSKRTKIKIREEK